MHRPTEQTVHAGAYAANKGRVAGLIINVLADGTLEIASAEISVEELRILAIDLVAESDGSVSPARPLVRADRNAPTASLNKVLSTLQRAGIPAVRIATAPGN